jgi:hypothetical protein
MKYAYLMKFVAVLQYKKLKHIWLKQNQKLLIASGRLVVMTMSTALLQVPGAIFCTPDRRMRHTCTCPKRNFNRMFSNTCG